MSVGSEKKLRRVVILSLVACGLGIMFGLWRFRDAPPTKRSPASPNTAEQASAAAPSHAPRAREPAVVGRASADAAREPPETFEYHERDPYEWQGMRVNLTMMAICDDNCGLAMACIQGKCGPCLEDRDCMAGERCVLDHCLLADSVACVSRADCAQKGDVPVYCVIGGVAEGWRGNEGLRSFCRASEGDNPDRSRELAAEAAREELRRAPSAPLPSTAMDYDSLRGRLLEAEAPR